MAIKGLTDQVSPRFQRIGQLRKGGEKVKGKMGPDLEHFRFTSRAPEVIAAFTAVYGPEPRNILVYIPHATAEEAFKTHAEIWAASGLEHRCDGETMSIWRDGSRYIKGSKPCPGGHTKGDHLNDAVGRLEVIIPELVRAGFVGYVTLETHSKHDILGILEVLGATELERAGNPLGLRGIPFTLSRIKRNISVPGYGKREGERSRADKWLVVLTPAPDWVKLQIDMAHAQTMNLPIEKIEVLDIPAGSTRPELPAGKGPSPNPVTPSKPKPSAAALVGQFEALGKELWPNGKWAEVSTSIKKSKRTWATRVKFLKDRKALIRKDNDVFMDHIENSWPGFYIVFEQAVSELEALEVNGVDLFAGLRGIAKAAAAKAKAPDLTDDDLAAVIIAEVTKEVPA